MSHQVALAFEDGVTRFIQVDDDQTVADASYRARINIPLDCRDGACGTCKSLCESGEFDGGSYIDDALTEDEAAQGYCLPCQMKPRSDLVLQIPSTSAVAKTQAATFTGTIVDITRHSDSTIGFSIETPERAKLAFLPGQYVNVHVPGTDDTRSYSFSSAPDDERLTFLVKLTPGGVMSTWLSERAQVGDEVRFTGPNGSFFLRDTRRPVLLLAGGTGLAPILAILKKVRADGDNRQLHLVYGVSKDEDLVELDTLAGLADQIDGFTWDYCVSDPGTGAPNKGYVMSLIRDEHLYDGDVAVYLCGPPPMVEAVRTHFTDQQLTPTGFYYEKFALSGPAPAPTSGPAAAPTSGPAAGATSPAGTTTGPVTGSAPAEPGEGGDRAPGGTPADETVTDADAAYGTETDSGTVGGAAEPAVQETDPETGLTQVAAPTVGVQVTGAGAVLLEDPSGRGLAGQEIFAADAELAPLGSGGSGPERTDPTDPADPTERTATARTLMGQDLWPAREGDAGQPAQLDEASTLVTDPDARSLAGQAIFAAGEIEPLHEPRPVPAAATTDANGTTAGAGSTDVTGTGTGGYEIGEEHPDVGESDAIFEAREALELGALALTIGRLSTTQLAGYRLLAEATVPYVQGDRFVDAAAYTETNAAFHDYLFTLTGNEHLLQAYQRLGVRGHMDQTLRNATWCDPRCAQDHLDIVTAFEGGDRDAARTLISEHAARSKETTRRAMREQAATRRPAFVTPGRFAGQVVVVTGAAQGIGEAVARRIHAEGGALVLADRSELVQELADELGGDTPAEAVVTDLETYSGARSVVDHAVARHGRVDVAIHNVGGAIWFKPFQEFTPEQIDAEIARSLMTTLYGCRAVLEPMVEAGRGTIVNVSSIATGGIHRVPYAAAKGGVNAITRALAVEAAEHGVRVVATAPGGTEAPPRRVPRGPSPEGEAEQEWFQAHIDQTLASAPMHRYGTLDEQAAAITFLASQEAGYITGTVLPVGGGDLG